MRKLMMVVMLVCFVGSGYCGEFKSKKANSAIEKYNAGVSKLAEKCIKDLEKSKKAAVKKGDLLEATKINEKINELRSSLDFGKNILSATYGSGSKIVDVKKILLKRVVDGKIELEVNNDTFDCDPASGKTKSCTVIYKDSNGKKKTIKVKEDNKLTIEF